ncbi:MAG: 2-oxoacid:acceptor oxidoreductase family protein [Candidatus Binatia bacterium]|nr:2-oxoacid:acceptor oxidoreductase family protein [Candidatus Binatia bacterium]
MDREILLTGIGGQGVQLAAKMLAQAGMMAGREVMQFSMFSGTMRGGSSECTVVVADGPVEAPPVVPHAWAAIAMHPTALGMIEAKLRPGSAILYNQSIIAEPPSRPDCEWFGVDAAGIAAERNNPQGQSLVALGAFATLTGLVAVDTLVESLPGLLPPYRHHTIPTNAGCLTAGAEAAQALADRYPAWIN